MLSSLHNFNIIKNYKLFENQVLTNCPMCLFLKASVEILGKWIMLLSGVLCWFQKDWVSAWSPSAGRRTWCIPPWHRITAPHEWAWRCPEDRASPFFKCAFSVVPAKQGPAPSAFFRPSVWTLNKGVFLRGWALPVYLNVCLLSI